MGVELEPYVAGLQFYLRALLPRKALLGPLREELAPDSGRGCHDAHQRRLRGGQKKKYPEPEPEEESEQPVQRFMPDVGVSVGSEGTGAIVPPNRGPSYRPYSPNLVERLSGK
ncbi:MAG: hypothetical protein M3N18_02045 [Actinomycetota bacterium]|nr:hypothetical protein [Actinomycetota bacterium]